MKQITELQKHIGAYFKTREVYAQHRKFPPKMQEELYAQYASAIVSCEAAKRYFDSLGLTGEEKERRIAPLLKHVPIRGPSFSILIVPQRCRRDFCFLPVKLPSARGASFNSIETDAPDRSSAATDPTAPAP